MKKITLLPWLLAFFLIFSFSGTTFAGGGPEDPACSADSFPDSSECPADAKRVWGEITVAREVDNIIPALNAYSVQISLRDKKRGKPKELHLFSFPTPRGESDLCALSEDELIEIFFRRPCTLGVHTAFGFVGLPVFEEFEIIADENCGLPSEMIQIRVVICDTEFVPELP